MQVQDQENSQNVENENVATTGEENTGTASSEEGEEGSEEQTYTPNTKFRTYKEEKAFDDFIAASIKNEEQEKKVRELYEKAYGLDYVKQDREQLKHQMSEYAEKAKKLSDLERDLQKVAYFKKSGDLASVFNELAISEEQVMKWAFNRQKVASDPNAAQVYEYQRQMLAQQYAKEQELAEIRAREEEQANYIASMTVQQREHELDTIMSHPTLASQIEQFDARMGRQGAFKEEVIRFGSHQWQTSGQDVPAVEAVKYVAGLAGFDLGQGQQTSQYAPANPNGGKPAASFGSQARKPTIPNISGSNSTQVKKLPKSINDLRNLYSQNYQ